MPPCAVRSLDQVGEPFRPLSPDELDREALLIALSALASRLEKPALVKLVGSLVEPKGTPIMATLDTTFDGSFSDALQALKDGKRVARRGWNGKGMWLVLLQPAISHLHGHPVEPCIGMKTATGRMQPGWLASQNDLLADDWEVLP